jgi:hypothetical protein
VNRLLTVLGDVVIMIWALPATAALGALGRQLTGRTKLTEVPAGCCWFDEVAAGPGAFMHTAPWHPDRISWRVKDEPSKILMLLAFASILTSSLPW